MNVPNAHTKALLLLKGLYGLKQSGRIWNRKFTTYLKSIGFHPIVSDSCVFRNPQTSVMIALYVDDLLIFSKKKESITEVKKLLRKEFSMKDLGPVDYILGMRVIRDREQRTLTLDQSLYINKFFSEYGMENSHPLATPVDGYDALTEACPSDERTDQLAYQQRIGSLMYAMTTTRPDIAFAVGKLSQFSHDPCVKHRVALDRVLRYLRGTSDLGLALDNRDDHDPKDKRDGHDPTGYGDAAYANEPK